MRVRILRSIFAFLSVVVAGYLFLSFTLWTHYNEKSFSVDEERLVLPRRSEDNFVYGNQILKGSNDHAFDEDAIIKCSRWRKDMEWTGQSVTPLFYTDPKKILYSGNLNGPNNELIAFQEAILVAILTNRTIVVPNFVPHEIDSEEGNNEPVPAVWRLDVGFLSRFVSMTTIGGMIWRCDSRFDVGFQNRRALCGYHQYIKKTTEMSIISKHQNLFFSSEFGLMETQLDANGKRCDGLDTLPVKRLKLFRDIANFSTLFHSELPCALMINSYCTYGRHNLTHIDENFLRKARKDPTSITRADIASTTKDTLAKVIEIFTRRPAYIRDIAREFIRDVIQNSRYIALHWRYNAEWENLFCHLIKKKKNECEVLPLVDSNSVPAVIVHLSKNFTKWMNMEDTARECTQEHVINTYFASAADDYNKVKLLAENVNFQNEILSRLPGYKKKEKQCWKIKVYNKDDLFAYVENKYPRSKCELIWRDKQELISLVENELCKISTVFTFSSVSSWSLVARQSRQENDKFPNQILIWDALTDVNPSIKKINATKL